MKTHYIENTGNRYSIGEDGNIISHYRNNRKGERLNQCKTLSKHFNTKKRGRNFSPCVSLYCNGRQRLFFVNSLMIKYFNLLPPDEMHKYKLYFKDGDNMNNSLDNLAWEIHTLKDYNFKPVAHHEAGIVVSKVCGECGDNKDITHYTYSCNPNHKGAKSKKHCYRNTCEQCRSIAQWDRIKSDPELLKKSNSYKSKWSSTEEGRKWHREYDKEYRDNLAPSYLRYIATKKGLNPDVMTPEMWDILKTSVQIRRETKLI